jgi:predicted RNA binding protein YcfA (HicA-like mRNA interferase family)
MASLDSRKVESALSKKGFVLESGDHKYFRLFLNDKDTGVYTKISHNSQDIGDILMSKMAKQLYMDKSFFKSFVECSTSQMDYEHHLREQKIIPEME